MRVIAGSARGRRLRSPDGTDTRPTSDRVREAVFNALFSQGLVVDARVADLFAGSGALGIEALSRGAAHVWFVERDRDARSVIDDNLDTLGFRERATVLDADATVVSGALGDGLDVVLADPPYTFDAWPALLSSVRPRLANHGVVVAEAGGSIAVPAGWEKMRERTYGGTVITFVTPPGDDRPQPPDDVPGAQS